MPMQLQRGGRLGSRPTYAAPWNWFQKSRLARKLRLKVQVATSTFLYTAEGLKRVKQQGKGDIVQGLQYHRFVS